MQGQQVRLDAKTRNFILYLVKRMAIPTKTGIIKMCYLCDLAAVNNGMKKITDFNYIRYYYGPYDRKIEDYLLDLIKNGDIIATSEYASGGGEYEKFSLSDKSAKLDDIDGNLTEKEHQIVEPILDELGSLNAKTLTQIAYKTKPMTSIGATLGGNEHLTDKLDLKA